MNGWILSVMVGMSLVLGQPATRPPRTQPPTDPTSPTPPAAPTAPVQPGTIPIRRPITTQPPAPLVQAPPECPCGKPTVGFVEAARPIVPHQPVTFSVKVDPHCPAGCAPTITGNWSITFIPGAQGDTFLNPDWKTRDPKKGVPGVRTGSGAGAVMQAVGSGESITYIPSGPGKIIARYSGRVSCGEKVCEPLLSASDEFDVAFPAVTPGKLQGIINGVKGQLPVIPGGDDPKTKSAAVAAWFSQSTGWKPGDTYQQQFDLPLAATAVTMVEVVSSTGLNISSFAMATDPLKPGGSAEGQGSAWGEGGKTAVGLSKRGGTPVLTLTEPTVDRFYVRITYLDAEGHSQQIEERCHGTIGPNGMVAHPKQVPAPGAVRILLSNVDPTRLGGDTADAFNDILKLIAQNFGGWAGQSSFEFVETGKGEMTRFGEYRIGGTSLSALAVAEYLREFAKAINAEVTVRDGFVMIQGKDFGTKQVLPGRYIPPAGR